MMPAAMAGVSWYESSGKISELPPIGFDPAAPLKAISVADAAIGM